MSAVGNDVAFIVFQFDVVEKATSSYEIFRRRFPKIMAVLQTENITSLFKADIITGK